MRNQSSLQTGKSIDDRGQPAPVAFAVLILGAVLQAHSATFYVSTMGSDLNVGSAGAPWQTVGHAASVALAGDSVIVAPGNYSERVFSRYDGTEANPITFLAETTNTIIGGFSISNRYYAIQGFTLSGYGNPAYQGVITALPGGHSLMVRSNIFLGGPPNAYQLLVSSGNSTATNVTAIFNKFVNGAYHGVGLNGFGPNIVVSNYFSSSNGWDAIRLLSSNTKILGNTFSNWSNLVTNSNHPDLIQSFSSNGEIATNNCIDSNFFLDCAGTQIGNITDDQNDGKISNWIWRNNLWANVAWVMSIYAPHFEFYNNVFFRSGTNSSAPLLFRASADRGNANAPRIFNNIFAECGSNPTSASRGWYIVDGGLTNIQANNNLVIGIGPGTAKTGFQANELEINGINGQSPRFINPTELNFRIQAISPCIGAGQAFNYLFTTDLAGVTRGGSWDIGAYQYQTGSLPAPPSNLRIIPPPGY